MMLYTRRSRLPPPPTSDPSTHPSLVVAGDNIVTIGNTASIITTPSPTSPSSISSYSASSVLTTESSVTSTTPVLPSRLAKRPPKSRLSIITTSPATIAFYQRGRPSKHAESKSKDSTTIVVKPARSPSPPLSSELDAEMVRRNERRDASCDSNLTCTRSTIVSLDSTRPSTPTSPVQIPRTSTRSRHHELGHYARRSNSTRRKAPLSVHSPDSLSPSMAALLAVTDIPRPRQSSRRPRRMEKPLAADETITTEEQLSEKELSWNFSRGYPLDMLLSPPESLDDDFPLGSDFTSSPMTRTISTDSVPSLGDSFVTDLLSSLESPRSPSPASSRRRMFSPMRKSLEPIRSPPNSIDEHPLSAHPSDDEEELGFPVLDKAEAEEAAAFHLLPFKPLRAAFKSNLTASLRALRSAAKSFSSINFPSIPPDDFLTRSLLTMDPKVPYADERRPPVSEEIPSAELRRYLNPTTRFSLEAHPGNAQTPVKFSASIQMQTYKIQRSRPTSRNAYPSTAPQSPSANLVQASTHSSGQESPAPIPVMRQREVRENPDFIRIAVMEMAMRRRGKLDNSKPGRAKWALPPRKTTAKPYDVGTDGVPERWIPITY